MLRDPEQGVREPPDDEPEEASAPQPQARADRHRDGVDRGAVESERVQARGPGPPDRRPGKPGPDRPDSRQAEPAEGGQDGDEAPKRSLLRRHPLAVAAAAVLLVLAAAGGYIYWD